jgi:hypothetical protein
MASTVTFTVLLCLAASTNNVLICPTLRSAINFTVIANSAVTNTGLTIINGNLAISPSVSFTGFNTTGVINGVKELGTAIALQAQKDVTTAYNYLMGLPPTSQMTGINLAGKTLQAGVYKFDSAAGIDTSAGILTLNGTGAYIFQVGSELKTTANSEIRTINGAKAECVFWVLGSSATIGQYSRFIGNILAYASIGLEIGVRYNGSIFARTAAVTLNTNIITGQATCDVCLIVPDPIHGTVSRNLPQNILFYIFIMFLVPLFRK